MIVIVTIIAINVAIILTLCVKTAAPSLRPNSTLGINKR